MKKYRYLLWDIDGTVLDFHTAEAAAIRTLFKKYRLGQCTDGMLSQYKAINKRYWQALERNEIEKSEILTGRFRDFFALYGLDTSCVADFNDDYQLALGDTIVFFDDAKTLLTELKGNYVLAAVTNGTLAAQEKKLSKSGLDKIFDYIFISEKIGVEKPNIGFFEPVMRTLDISDKSEAIIIGDSLTSDVRGGNNIGIDTCWYNPNGKPKDVDAAVNYEIRNLNEIKAIIGAP